MFDLSDHPDQKLSIDSPFAAARKTTFCFKYVDRVCKPVSPSIPIIKEMDYHASGSSGTFEILEK
jgi:hypothetical protein